MAVTQRPRTTSKLQKIVVICACLFVSLMISGCKDRTAEVIGVWEWDKYTVHFDVDSSWGASAKGHAGNEKIGGTWSMDGDTLRLNYATTVSPDSTFILSQDGKSLEADTAATGTMKKRFSSLIDENH